MTIKTTIKNATIVVIYSLIFISAFLYMQSTQIAGELWKSLYLMTMYAIAILCFCFIFLHRHIQVSSLGLLLIGMLCYEMIVSVRTGQFIFPKIIADCAAWPLIILTFLSYARENEMPKIMKPITMIGFILICFETGRILINRSVFIFGSAVFTTYFCFAFLPLIYYFYSVRTSIIASLIVAILMLLTLKRAAFIIIVLGISLYYIETIHIQNISIKKVRRQIVLLITFLIIGFLGQYLISQLDLNILNRLSTISEDGGSGRIRIWELVYREFTDSTLSQKLFGHGFQAVYYQLRPSGISRFAHNSFLEMLYDYGYIGLALIILFVIRIIVLFISMSKKKCSLAPVLGYTLIPMMILGFVSYFFEQSVIIIPFAVVWGICFGSMHMFEKAQASSINSKSIY